MITIVLTYRNRNLNIVKKCFDSLLNQTNKHFKIVLVDYGSIESYKNRLVKLVEKCAFIELIRCETEQQLWCKSRAINIVLKQCQTPYFFVGDIDMIYHPHFVEILHSLKNDKAMTYFQVGFLSESESKKDKAFNDYKISFKSSNEATGMTLYKTDILKSINGYDEFYNGWGSEDTDIHIRLKNDKKTTVFYDKGILILHQWHPKTYRNKESTSPFHSNLEKINQKYLEYTKITKRVSANKAFKWGDYNPENYKLLNTVNNEFTISNELSDVKGFVSNVLLNLKNEVVSVKVKRHKEYKSLNYIAKKILNKKTKVFLNMQIVNDLLLEAIIMNLRNCPYKFVFNRNSLEISLTIKL
ncbi:glycosyltransferase [Flavivirga spongiicola]|uniref:Galactosyltransferase-related protein n=1 Tax=Flavivirga spongiicola TaxID=421621 RepID=A0ABU7XN86_9FLAO|nr:glycosyltransferase [Flavivirga sp. MEBiC05379]MDO5981665.1 galactosyltransferase-related protein [Flavivirga sp. MEBiC05379]